MLKLFYNFIPLFILLFYCPIVYLLQTFSVYPYIENKPLQASKIFSGLALFNIMGLPLYLVTLIINVVTHAKISTDRILPFLLSPEAESAQQVAMATEGKEFVQKVGYIELIDSWGGI